MAMVFWTPERAGEGRALLAEDEVRMQTDLESFLDLPAARREETATREAMMRRKGV